jgi:hypothetical protein
MNAKDSKQYTSFTLNQNNLQKYHAFTRLCKKSLAGGRAFMLYRLPNGQCKNALIHYMLLYVVDGIFKSSLFSERRSESATTR